MKVDLARIDAKSSEGETFSIDVNEDNPVALGRGPELKIDATSISRKHLEIRLLANQVILKCNHKAGVKVLKNGKKKDFNLEVKKETVVSNGDIIKFLPEVFHYKVHLDSSQSIDTDQEATDEDIADEKQIAEPKAKKVQDQKLPEWIDSEKPKKPKPQNRDVASSSGARPKNNKDSKEAIKASELEPASGLMETLAYFVQKMKSSGDQTNYEAPKVREKSSKKNKKRKEQKPVCRYGANCQRKNSQHFQREIHPIGKNGPKSTKKKEENSKSESNEDSEHDTEEESDQSSSSSDDDSSNDKSEPRPMCRYGASCTRKNPHHRKIEAHPGDEDYQESDEDGDEGKPECQYGVNCYRKNPRHKATYKHTTYPTNTGRKSKAPTLTSGSESDD